MSYRVTATGPPKSINIAPASVAEEVLQNVRTLLTTIKCQIPLDRAFGIDGSVIDLPMPQAQAFLTNEIFTAIRHYEPRARIEKIDKNTIEAFRNTLERDFDCQHPRIAILSDNAQQENNNEEPREEKHMHVYGPYAIKEFFEEEKYMYYDGIITCEKQKATEAFGSLAYEYGIRFYAGSDLIITSPFLSDTMCMNHATYIATDVYRNRQSYDQERENPLPKLFHDKREDRNSNNVE